MKVDLVIKNGLVVTKNGVLRGGLSASDGKIREIGNDETLSSGRREIDANGNFVLPGLIDAHTHLHGSGKDGTAFNEAIRSESISGAVNGVTTIISTAFMPTGVRHQLPTIVKLREAAIGNSQVDFKLSAYIFYDSHIDEMASMMNEGVTSFKFLMGFTQEEAESIGAEAINWDMFYKGAEMLGRIGPPAIQLVHCEEPNIPLMLMRRLKAAGRSDLAAWEESRPAFIEAMYVFAAGLVAGHVGSRLYIVHISSKDGLDAVSYLRTQGTSLWAETCAHYLVLTKQSPYGVWAKCAPPVRDELHQKALWNALARDQVQIVGSDQCFHPLSAKEKGIWEAAPGAGMIGSVFPVMATNGVNKGRIGVERLVKVCAENPARAFSIYPQKGTLSVGADADIIIVDMDQEWEITDDNLKSSVKHSGFRGYKAKGKVTHTFVRGELVAERGILVTHKPRGTYVYSQMI